MAKISIYLQADRFPGPYDCDIAIPLDRHIVDAVLQPLDRPSDNASGFDRFMCSSEAVIEKVTMEREELAKLLTKEIVAGLIELFESKDTKMGYTKAEDAEIYGG